MVTPTENGTDAPHVDADVLIVGGGMAGLLCALECKKNGFATIVLESKSSSQSAGDFISLGESVLRGLRRWPDLWAKCEDKGWKVKQTFHRHTGEKAAGPMRPLGLTLERPTLHSLLMQAACDEGIDVRCKQRVTIYSESTSTGWVELSNGETLSATIVVAADGIHSKSWQVVTGKEPQVHPSGNAMFRTAFPVEHALMDPGLREKWQADTTGDPMAFFLGPHSHGIMCFTKDTAAWVWMHNDDPETSLESWTATLSSEDALKQLDAEGEWSPDFRAIIAATPPKHIVDWRLMWRDLQEQWVSPRGRIVQIGDAAHAFLPTSVNGGTQALEDAISLPVCLRLAVEKDEDGVAAMPMGARVHNKLRLDRVSCLQKYGVQRRNAFRNVDWEAAKTDTRKVAFGPPKWQTEHDPAVYAEEQFDSCKESLLTGVQFGNTNVAPGYVHQPWRVDEIVDSLDSQQATVGDALDWKIASGRRK